MSQIVRLQRLARNVVMTVPTAIRRELEITARHYVYIERGPGRTFIVRPVEEQRRGRAP